jgi:hypothetical protein
MEIFGVSSSLKSFSDFLKNSSEKMPKIRKARENFHKKLYFLSFFYNRKGYTCQQHLKQRDYLL